MLVSSKNIFMLIEAENVFTEKELQLFSVLKYLKLKFEGKFRKIFVLI
jgi:hypothetical protein